MCVRLCVWGCVSLVCICVDIARNVTDLNGAADKQPAASSQQQETSSSPQLPFSPSSRERVANTRWHVGRLPSLPMEERSTSSSITY